MCTYLHGPREGGTYYFRRSVPARLRPIIGQREYFFSLETKDRAEAKELVGHETVRTTALLKAAEKELARQQAAPIVEASSFDPFARMSQEAFERQQAYDAEEARTVGAKEARREELADYMAHLENRLAGSTEQMPRELRAFRYILEGREFDMALIKDQLAAARVEKREIEQRLSGSVSSTPAPIVAQRTSEGNLEPVTITALYEGYAVQAGNASTTESEWRSRTADLVAFLGHDHAHRVTAKDIRAWRDHVRDTPKKDGEPRSPKTVNVGYLAVAKVIFAYGEDEGLIASNPAADVNKLREPRETQTRERDFTPDEQQMILAAALEPVTKKFSDERKLAFRWVPWLCAYTGARVNEMTQLRAEDVQKIDGTWTLLITPEAGRVKTKKHRYVPIHQHLIEQGFLVATKGKTGPLFYNPELAPDGSERGQYKKTGQKLADWVRGLGITDAGIMPNHAWRHTFKTIAREAGLDEAAHDYMTGHASKAVGRTYGRHTLPALAAQLAKFPRFHVEDAKAAAG